MAFWDNARSHVSGVLQAIPDEPETEVVLESTANGIGNFFHEMWQAAEAGQSEYEAIFVPWFWQSEYQAPVPEGFNLTPEESLYQASYGLTLEQMAWRRSKIAPPGDINLFRREYPADAAEAFEVSGEDSFITPDLVRRARQASLPISDKKPLLIGLDPARFGEDRTSFARRRGRVAFGIQSHMKLDTMQVAGLAAEVIDRERPRKLFVDVGGLGAGVYDRLVELGYGDTVIPVNSGERAVKEDRYVNRRAEMWGKMKEWLADEAPVQIPDSNVLHADLTGPHYSYDSSQRVRLERKEDMRKRGVRSPDEGDALALTFAVDIGPAERLEPLEYPKLAIA